MKKSSPVAKTGIVKKILTFFVALATLMVMFQTSGQTALADDSTGTLNPCLPASSTGGPGTLIDSATVAFTDASGKAVDKNDVTKDTNVSLSYAWSVPKELNSGCTLKSGDTYTFNLPAGVTYTPRTGTLSDYGTFTIDATGKVTFTFNDSVNNNDDISGTFNYSSSIVKTETTGTKTITVPTKTGETDVTYIVRPTGGSDISKAGALTGETNGKNATGITWDVTINTSGKDLTNATVSDPMPSSADGQVKTKLNDVQVYPLTVDVNGNVTATGDALVKGTDYTVDADGTVAFIGKYASTTQAFKVRYLSDIVASTLPVKGGTETFTNTAELNNNGTKSDATASVWPSYGKFLDKGSDGQDNNGSQVYNWHIDYNGQDASQPAGSTITDTLSDGEYYGTPSVVYNDGSGKTVDPSLYKIAYSKDDNNKSVMTITFPNGIDKAVTIKYQSQITTPIDDTKTAITNTASSNDTTASANSGTLGQQGLTKSLGGVDYNKKQATWNFDINMARQKMSNWSMTDPVPDGLTVDYNSFVLKDKDTNTVLNEGTDYQITTDGNGFKLEFIGALKTQASDWYTLSYNTTFDTLKLPTNGKWTNSATATWTDSNGDSHTNKGTADFTPKNEFKNDGSKSGSYNAKDKTITWTVVANYNQRTLTKASISDPIVGNQSYVDGSAQVFEATINKDGSYTQGDDVTASVNPSYSKDSKTVSASLPENSTKAYVLIFKTSIGGQVITDTSEKNSATYTNGDESNKLDASVSVPNGNKFVEKAGSQDSSDASYVDWNIWINKSQSTLDNAVVNDTPSTNQIVDESSIKIYPANISNDGNNFTPDTANPLTLNTDYTVDLTTDSTTGQQALKISFKKTIDTPYLLQYRSLINSSLANDTVSNKVNVVADKLEVQNTTDTSSVDVVNSGGSATGKNTNIVIKKTDADTGALLDGATFELYSVRNGAKGTLLRTGTATDGQLTWGNMKSGKYILVETKAPAGYTISSAMQTGVTIDVEYTANTTAPTSADVTCTVDVSNNTNTCTVKDEKTTGSVILTKTDSDTNKTLAGAVFDLYTSDGAKVKSGVTTGDKGTVQVDGLKPGDYYFVETQAPAGYKLDTDHVSFTIAFQNPVKVATASATNAQKTGSVILTKTDSDTNKTLAGAVFDLYTSKGEKIKSDVTTGDDGTVQVDGLKPGDYYFVETQAPAGYKLDNAKLNFTVEMQTTAKVATVSATNAEKPGSVVLTKTDSDTGNTLAGAVFDLYKVGGSNSDDIKIASGLITDSKGTISYDDLLPGSYYFIETKAPAGYDLNDAKWNFKITLQTTLRAATVQATNAEKTGSVVLTKTDTQTGKTLAGAVFDLYTSKGEKIKSGVTTGDKGTVQVDGLKPGDYYFVESAAPAGYVKSDAKLKFTVQLQTTAKVAAVSATNDQQSGSVVLTKTDSDTNKTLAGAVFNLYTSDDTQVKSGLTTDSNGKLTVDGLLPGDYYFQESQAPAGYELNSDHIPFTIAFQNPVKVAAVSATNAEKTGSVVLTKTDTQTGKTLAGAVFDLYTSDGAKVKSGVTTGDKGTVQVDGLKPGDYYFQESQAPAGYKLDNAKLNFTVQLQTTAKVAAVSATNDQESGSVVLTKTDTQTGKTLAGAVFDLYTSKGEKIKSGVTTDSNGKLTVDGLLPGDYYFVESAAPAGYVKSDAKLNFTVQLQTTAKVAAVSATNSEQTGSVVLTKIDGDSNTPLSGAVFNLYKPDGTKIKSGITTGEGGKVKVDGLLPGDYYFQESQAPAGYELNSDHIPFTIAFQNPVKVATASATNAEKTGSVVLTKTDSDTNKPLAGAVFSLYKADGSVLKSDLTSGVDGTVSVDGLKPGDYYFVETQAPAGYILNDAKLNFTVELQTTAKVATASATNAEKTGSVVLTKTDSDTNKPLANAIFDLYKADGTKIQSGVKTGKEGTVQVDGLKPGDYYFVETQAPAGYILNDAKLNFTVELQTEAKIATVSASNAEITGSVVLTKTDSANGKKLSGAVFSLYKADGTKLQSGLTTGANGKLTVDGLKPGDYYFQETQAPKGYKLDSKKLDFTVALQIKTIDATVNAKNDKIPATPQQSNGESPLAKTGAAVAGLAGAAAVLAVLGFGSVIVRSKSVRRKH